MKHKIVFEDWDYTCGDGCCYEYGTTLTINGNEVSGQISVCPDELAQILEALGVEFEIED